MVIVKFVRWLRGYVRFTATGGFTERFLNILAVHSINIWGICKSGEVLKGCMLASDYRRLRCMIRRTGVRLRISKKCGFPFGAKKYRKRLGVLVGFLVFLLFLGIMSNFVWEIEVTGNEQIGSETITDELAEMGLKKGVLKSSLDTRYMEKKALTEIDGISWMGISIKGSKVVVDVKESTEAPEVVPIGEPCNIVASKSGQIMHIEVYEGQAVLKKGDTVQKGDLIVSGITQDKKGNNMLMHALAKVVARYTATIEIKVPLKQTVKNYTGEVVTRNSLHIFGVKLPLYLATKLEGQYEKKSSESQVNLFGMELPFDIIEDQYVEYTENNVTYTEQQAQKIAEEELNKKLESEYQESEPISQEITTSLENDVLVLKAKYVFEEDIAQSEKILVDEKSIEEAKQQEENDDPSEASASDAA